jgi:putative ABC transport system permease protein
VNLYRLAIRNLTGNAFRSLAIFLCAALVASLALTTTFVVRGAEAGLRRNLGRLGADILVLPWGTITDKIEGVRIMSAAVRGWIPLEYAADIAALAGVDAVSPQLYLFTLEDSPYSPYPKLFLVAYDPATDFTLRPWLHNQQALQLQPGQAVAGAHVALPGGGPVTLFGSPLSVVDRLERTETSIDNTLFVSFETASQMIAWSAGQDEDLLQIVPGSVSAIMVRVAIDSDPHQVALHILDEVKGVTPLETPNFFQTERRHMIGVLRTLLGSLSAIWILTVVFMGLVFSFAVNERRFELGVLRALGFPGAAVLKTLLLEGIALAVLGGLTGVVLTIVGFSLYSEPVIRLTGLPLSLPSPAGLAALSVGGLALTLCSVLISAFIPAWRISREEVAVTMHG